MLYSLSSPRGLSLALAMSLLVGLSACRPSPDRVAAETEPDASAAPTDKDSSDVDKDSSDVGKAKLPPPHDNRPADESSASNPKDKPDREQQPAKKQANRLAAETSPYLLMHAHNPVDWYPWGPEAFQKATDENKPIFLSIGYSSCYWCHVMERESFMDEEVAELLNKHFVCIKIDREERPDIDQIYMTALTQVMQRHGGWPLSMFLTPEGKPFYGLTYLPARDGDREGFSTGFLTLAGGVHDWWVKYEDDIRDTSEMVSDRTALVLRGRPGIEVLALEQELIGNTLDDLHEDFDPRWGGFGYAPSEPRRPKFPEPSNLFYLLDRLERGDIERMDDAQTMLLTTLDKMHQGGIYDHLGGGFHRYSTDRFWHIPHFEKMLYDNGQLASVYAQAYALTERESYRRVVDGILGFVQREMTGEGGAFYAALDAETDAEEGKFYRWETQELKKLLDEDEFALFAAVYGVGGEPNFEEHYYALLLEQPLSQTAEKMQMSEGELIGRLTPLREKLFASRSQRPRPLTDTKILTADNGLMIRGFADAGRYLDNPQYVAAAEKAAQFVLDQLRTQDGRLLRTYSQGEAKLNAYLDDYAFLADGLIALHRATGERKWLDAADALTGKQLELFWDDRHGGFFFTSNDHEELIARAKDPVDGALPAGNSVSAGNLLYLARQLDKAEYLDRAERTIRSSSAIMRSAPKAAPRMTNALAEYLELRPAEKEEETDEGK